jgi:hypothetical protein
MNENICTLTYIIYIRENVLNNMYQNRIYNTYISSIICTGTGKVLFDLLRLRNAQKGGLGKLAHKLANMRYLAKMEIPINTNERVANDCHN